MFNLEGAVNSTWHFTMAGSLSHYEWNCSVLTEPGKLKMKLSTLKCSGQHKAFDLSVSPYLVRPVPLHITQLCITNWPRVYPF